jgi:hypothetical protein
LRCLAAGIVRSTALGLACLVIAALPAQAGNRDREVEHLLSFIEQSGCTFIRNDKTYTASRARDHLERKYGYAKSKIESAEQFIEHIGTASSRNGKAYQIRCGENEQPSGEWLAEELSRYRASMKASEFERSGQSL